MNDDERLAMELARSVVACSATENGNVRDILNRIDAALSASPAPGAGGEQTVVADASEQEAESAIRHLKIVIDAAENSNQSGENAVVRAALVTGWKRS